MNQINNEAPQQKKGSKSVSFWVALVLVLFIASTAYFFKRQIMASESNKRGKIAYYVSGAINRALLLDTDDFQNTKSDMRKELKLLFRDTKIPIKYCRISDDGNLYAIMPDGSIAPAEYQNCYTSGHKRVYREGIAEKIYHNFFKWIPIINMYVCFYLGDVFNTVIIVPEEILQNENTSKVFYDALKNPCKYLAAPKSYNYAEEREYRSSLANFDFNAWENLFCNQDEQHSFSLDLRVIKDKDHYIERPVEITNITN